MGVVQDDAIKTHTVGSAAVLLSGGTILKPAIEWGVRAHVGSINACNDSAWYAKTVSFRRSVASEELAI